MPTLPLHPPPHARIATLIKTLVREHDEVHSDAVWAGIKLVTEHETQRTVEARAKALRQKVVEVEEARWVAKSTIMEPRASLGLLETVR